MGSSGLTMSDLPNILIMFAALIALFIMLVILLRNMEVIGIVGERGQDAWTRAMQPSRLVMQKVHIPFTFKLLENTPINYNVAEGEIVNYYYTERHPVSPLYPLIPQKGPTDIYCDCTELNCTVSSRVKYWRANWWGAPVRELHSVLWGPFSEFKNALTAVSDSPHDEKRLRLRCEDTMQLGPPPRARYPLVVVLAREDQSSDELRPDDTVALISVVHIRDDQCPLPSGIIAQYLKQANGHLSCLKQLYVTGESPEPETEVQEMTDPDELCCVCASRPLSRALLPCRHACLCHACLPKLDKCPICRSMISSYFCIRNEDEPRPDMKQQRYPFNRRLLNLFHYH